MLKSNIIRHSYSEFNNPCILVNKKDGTKRLVIDFRKTDKIIKTTAYPLPRIEEMIASLNGAKQFTCLDLSNPYNQIPIKEEDQVKTAFSTSFGFFEWTVLPQGLNISAGKFQSIMSSVIKGCEEFSVVYLDDFLIYCKTLEEHFDI